MRALIIYFEPLRIALSSAYVSEAFRSKEEVLSKFLHFVPIKYQSAKRNV